MIEYVYIDGQRANIANREFPDYFSVDSMAALIGPNGSGKTRLLLNVAEALTTGAPIGDQGSWSGWDANGQPVGADTKSPPAGQGVLYYTPLPYRRRVASHKHLFDASAPRHQASRSRSYRHYSFIAQRLGVNARLVGRLSYRHDIYRRLLVPRMLEPDCRLLDPVMESRRADIAGMEEPVESNIVGLLEDFAHSVEAWVSDVLERSDHDPVVTLACLEHTARSLSHRSGAIQAFLETIGIATFAPAKDIAIRSRNSDQHRHFQHLISTTAGFLDHSRQRGVHPYSNLERTGYEVQIDHNSSPRELEGQVGAFDISWENVSSGLLSLVEQFTRLEHGLERLHRRRLRSVLVLIDEGDAYLHLDWQRQYVFHLDQFLGDMKRSLGLESLQVLLATHSPIISGDFPSAMVQRLGSTTLHAGKTFGSSLDALVLDTFGTASIGEFAAGKLRHLRRQFVTGNLRASEMKLIREIGDDALRHAITSPAEDEA